VSIESTTVFINARLFTAGQDCSTAGALAVRHGRILSVGHEHDVRRSAGPDAEVVDIEGGLLMPGFQDAHVHPVMAGIDMGRCELHGSSSARECLDRIAAYAAATPEAPWVLGGGWSMDFFPGGTPTRQALDAVVPDRPAILTNRDGHGAWVNTAALRVAGITAEIPDPADGRIEREADGHPSGALHEGAMSLVLAHAPAAGPDDAYRGLLRAQQHLFSLGITSWQDAAVGPVFGMPDLLETYRAAAEAGDLKGRVVGALWWDREAGIEQIESHVERRTSGAMGRFRPIVIKIMQDGVAENFTAAMTEPYLDGCGCATGNAGLSFVDPEALQKYVARLDAVGFSVHFHALGDRAVREALDAVEVARHTNGFSANRHHLAHLQVVHPDDVPRFATLGATANMQPLWACHEPQMDELTIPFLGERRAAWQYPFKALDDSGAHLAAGSDWPVSSADPLEGIHVAVNRRHPGSDSPAFFPENALTLAQALTAYTAGSAYVNHHEDVTGHLRPGFHADLVMLDRDPFTAPREEISQARVLRTYVGGELVHDADTARDH
jgi:hypothetical protein